MEGTDQRRRARSGDRDPPGGFRIHYVEYSEAEVDGLVASLLPNETGRHFHVLHAHDFTDFVRDALPGEVLGIDEIESATQRIGLGWSVHDGDNNVEGAEACVGLLNRLVDAQVGDLTSRLGELDRTALVERILLNHEAAHVRELQWQRTSAAVLCLHGDLQDVRDAVVGQLSKLAGAAITSRVLVEIAACEAPLTGGRLPDDLQIQALLAQVELVTRLGGLSDGIHYGVLRPHLRVSALGDILLRDEFGREVVAPMLSQAVGSNYVDSAGGFRRHYGPQEGVDRTEHLLDSEFLEAWQGKWASALMRHANFSTRSRTTRSSVVPRPCKSGTASSLRFWLADATRRPPKDSSISSS